MENSSKSKVAVLGGTAVEMTFYLYLVVDGLSGGLKESLPIMSVLWEAEAGQ